MVIFRQKEFIEYLEYIVNIHQYNNIFSHQGIITKETALSFNKKLSEFTQNKNKEIKEIDLMKNVLYLYIKELNDELIKSISETIMNNFILYKQKMINRKLKSVFNIYKIKQQIFLSKKLSQWNHNLLNSNSKKNNNNYFNLNLNVGPIINNNSPNEINHENYLNKQKNSSENINSEKSQKRNKRHIRSNDMNNINTFNKSNSLPNMINNIDINSDKHKKKIRPLSSDESRYNYKTHKNKAMNLSAKKNFEEKILSQKMKRNKNSAEKIDKFIKRQEIFSKNNFQKKEKIIKDNEDENKLIYTFEPKINDSLRKLYKNDNTSVGKRLYNDSIVRRNKKLEKEYSKSNLGNNINKKVFNQKKIIELYEDYNIRKEKNKELIKKIEKECGYTYVPSVLHKRTTGGYSNNKTNKAQSNNSKNKIKNKNKINNVNNNKKLKKSNSCNEAFPITKNK